MENKNTTINIYDFSIWCMASLYFFLPRRFYLLGMYSFRAILLGLLFLLVVNNHGRIEYKRVFNRRKIGFWFRISIGYSFSYGVDD